MVDPTMFSSELATMDTSLSLNNSVREFEKPSDASVLLLWFVFAVMLVGTIVFAAISWNVPPSKRLYHYLAATITSISTLSYFSLATYTGAVLRHAAIHDPQAPFSEVYRHILYRASWIRYVDWTLSFPLTLIVLGLVSGVEVASLFASIVAALILTVAGFHSGADYPEKIGWIVFAVLAHLLIAHQLLLHGRSRARKRGPTISKFYTAISAYTIAVWLGYIVAWILFGQTGEGHLNAQVGTYAVLDVLSKSVFGAWLLFACAKVPELAPEFESGCLGCAADEGRIRIGGVEEEG